MGILYLCVSVCVHTRGVSPSECVHMCLVCVPLSIKSAIAQQAWFSTLAKPTDQPASHQLDSAIITLQKDFNPSVDDTLKRLLLTKYFPWGLCTCLHTEPRSVSNRHCWATFVATYSEHTLFCNPSIFVNFLFLCCCFFFFFPICLYVLHQTGRESRQRERVC